MSDSVRKYHEGLKPNNYNEGVIKFERINNILTPLQAIHIINRLLLHCNDDDLTKDAEVLKEWIKSK